MPVGAEDEASKTEKKKTEKQNVEERAEEDEADKTTSHQDEARARNATKIRECEKAQCRVHVGVSCLVQVIASSPVSKLCLTSVLP